MTGPNADSKQQGVTARAIILGLVLVALCAPAAFMAEIRFATTYMFGSGIPAMAPLAILMILSAINPFLRRVHILPLSRKELLSVYAIVLIGAPLVTHGILSWLLSTGVSLYYGAITKPEWNSFLPLLPTWFAPSDPVAVNDYFIGKATVPWSLWLQPSLAWGSFMVALFLATLCLVVIWQRQWITHERLSFPFAQVPLELVQEDGQHSATFSSNTYLWIGLLSSFGIVTFTYLSGIIPALPAISLTGPTLMEWRNTGPLAGIGAWELWLPPGLIAIAYLVPKDLSFSCWFFWVVRVALTVIAIAAGGTPQRPEEWTGSNFPAPTYQGGGAVLAIAIWMIWISRKHLNRVFQTALGRSVDDAPVENLWTYRIAIFGFLICTIYLIGFYMMAGARLTVGIIMVLLIIVHYVVWARMRADTGLGFIPFPLLVSSMMIVPFGSGILRPKEVLAILSTRWSYYPGYGESFEVTTGSALEALKIADTTGISPRRLVTWMAVGLILAVIVGIYVFLTGEYRYGFLNTPGAWHGWTRAMLSRNGSQAFDWMNSPTRYDANGMLGIGAGVVVTLALGFMRGNFWWWPLHPIGYLAANCWGMHWFSQPFFVGWLLKSLVTRYGGLGLYRRTVPLATGLILGDSLGEFCWVVLKTVLDTAGVSI